MAKRWADLKARLSEERQERIALRKDELLVEMDLREIRKLLGVTQAQLAERLQTSQGEVSQAERRGDTRLSTLRRYVEALGGKIEIIADFGDKRFRLAS
jgi:transcriptional regulator with XRE-family HTH domain